MNFVQYYYSNGKEKYGPFTLEELKQKKIEKEYLIWHEGEPDWRPLSAYPSLLEVLTSSIKVPQGPPPLPVNKPASITLSSNRKSQHWILIICVWTTIHLFALLMSYTNIKFFNAAGLHEKEEFWPFVEFKEIVGYRHFNHGLFYQYDWTEFALYVGVVWVAFLLSRLAVRTEKIA